MKPERQQGVTEARLHNDTAALARMGHAGGLRSARNRRLRIRALQILEIAQARLYSISQDGDVLPPDYEAIEE